MHPALGGFPDFEGGVVGVVEFSDRIANAPAREATNVPRSSAIRTSGVLSESLNPAVLSSFFAAHPISSLRFWL